LRSRPSPTTAGSRRRRSAISPTLRFVEAKESVILHDPVEVGKTMIAQALGHAACRQRRQRHEDVVSRRRPGGGLRRSLALDVLTASA
jgi:DNA replication protein DnaC